MGTVRRRQGGAASKSSGSKPATSSAPSTGSSQRSNNFGEGFAAKFSFKALGILILTGLVGTIVRFYSTEDRDKYYPASIRLRRDEFSNMSVFFWDNSGSFSTQDQIDAIIHHGEPTLILDSPVLTWPAMQKWGTQYLADAVPTLHGVRSQSSSNVFFNEELSELSKAALEAGIGEKPTQKIEESKSTMEFFSTPSEGSTSYEYYASSLLHDSTLEPLFTDLGAKEANVTLLNDTFAEFAFKKKVQDVFLWLGRAGTEAGLHYDTSNNFNVQIFGRKTFTIYPVTEIPKLRMYPSFHISARQAMLEEAQLNLEGKKSLTLVPGQVLFLPPYHLHSAKAVDDAANVNIFSPSKLREGHKLWLREESISPPALKELLESDPEVYPSTVSAFILGFSAAIKSYACTTKTSFRYDMISIKPVIAKLVEERMGYNWAAYNCADWDPRRCPDLSKEIPTSLRGPLGDIMQFNLRLYKNTPCETLGPLLETFIADWIEAVSGSNIGFDKMCSFLRCTSHLSKNEEVLLAEDIADFEAQASA